MSWFPVYGRLDLNRTAGIGRQFKSREGCARSRDMPHKGAEPFSDRKLVARQRPPSSSTLFPFLPSSLLSSGIQHVDEDKHIPQVGRSLTTSLDIRTELWAENVTARVNPSTMLLTIRGYDGNQPCPSMVKAPSAWWAPSRTRHCQPFDRVIATAVPRSIPDAVPCTPLPRRPNRPRNSQQLERELPAAELQCLVVADPPGAVALVVDR